MGFCLSHSLRRIIIGTLLPILLMWLYTDFYLGFSDLSLATRHPIIWDKILYLAVGIVFIAASAFVPGFFASLLMEKVVNPYIKNHLLVVLIAAMLGFVNKVSIETFAPVSAFTIESIVVGAMTGSILRWLYIRENHLYSNE